MDSENAHPSVEGGIKEIWIQSLDTPVGSMVCGVLENGICLLEYDRVSRSSHALSKMTRYFEARIRNAPHPLIRECSSQLDAYFSRQRTRFELPLVLAGTPFQKKVWKQLMDIPYGQTISYTEQAHAFGNPHAIRAIARANGSNHLAILVPCHRVIGSDGSLRGYGGGTNRKQFLLQLERSDAGTLFEKTI